MPISHVQLFSVPVADQNRARAFYTETLGFELVAETDMGPDMRWVQVRPVGAATSLTLVTWFPSMPAGSMKGIVLETDSLESTISTLRDKGVAIGEIERAPWGRFVTFDDPDGNGIVLQETAGQG
jgi:catechol 2,3-dioxygenase-like lactoylglutathione lyase family enzyme